MNLSHVDSLPPIRVLIVNPLSETGVMLCVKLFRGVIFGIHQIINLTLLVYSNELEKAEQLKFQLDGSGFPCKNLVTIVSEVPSISDADIFIFITDFPSPNSMDFNNMDDDDIFDTMYLLLKIARNLEMPPPPENPPEEPLESIKTQKKASAIRHRTVIATDSLVALDILKSFSKNLPNDIFFCPTPITSIAKTVLAEKLAVHCDQLNNMFVWAANDDVFHIDVQVPLYRQDLPKRKHCEWEVMAKQEYEELKLDYTQFNAAWLKKEFIQKIAALCLIHPNGSIYKADKMCKMIRGIFSTRRITKTVYDIGVIGDGLGIISDGSLETIKGLPYILPVKFEGETYKINKHLQYDYHLKKEINKINKVVQEHHRKLIHYCKDFLQKNVISMQFVPKSEESSRQDLLSESSTSTE